jgi:DNA polymerase-4
MIACLSVSYFAATVERRDNGELAQTPLVVGGQPWEPRPLFGYSREAAQRGVKPGMSLRLAHVLSPHSHFVPAALPRYQGAAGEVVDVLTDFTHLVEPENLWQPPERAQPYLTAATRCLPAHYYVDLESLPLREATPLSQEIGRTVRSETRLAPSVGLAADRFTAQVAATLGRPNHLRPVTPETERDFLAQRSISFLPFQKETARRLHLLGIRTLGQFARLPQNAVQEQFGAEALPLHRLARGEASQRTVAQPAPPALKLARHFEPPLGDSLIVRNVLQQMAMALAGRLQADHHATGVLTLSLETETGKHQQRLALRQPTAHTEHLLRYLLDLQEQLAPDTPIVALTLSAAELVPWTAQQLSLFDFQARRDAKSLYALLPGIMTRHKDVRFYRPYLDDSRHPLPECRFRLQPAL